ncbi:tRNA dihydrouridine synthase DusB [Xylocopilactobacillus apicola]|uniref:tRNA dihydrouridine synthase DusB n=1 Tax=Xylocopilactobacillus apicola TaxID=2932184 RepID=UPI002952D16B|nr:tRNA dihydrouridine synthase DusB [Xylocopilactobacillus apicola]
MTLWKIGNIEIQNQIVVAPMAGITNTSFRLICREFGAGLVVCEMISDRGIIYRNEKTLGMLLIDPNEHPVSVQIFGGTKETLVEAAQFVANNTSADIIDINMGCPVNKIVKTEAGAKWLLDPEKVYEMAQAVVQAVDKPVTVKMRTGWDQDHILAIENALAAQEAGVGAIAMHGRTRAQMYRGHADWDLLGKVAEKVEIPFVGNGDVKTPQEAKTLVDDYGCTAVMIGRAVLGNPWFLKRTDYYLRTGQLLPEPSVHDKIESAITQLERLCELKGEKLGVREFRQFVPYYLKGIKNVVRTKIEINKVDDKDAVADLLRSVEGHEYAREGAMN